MYRRSHPYLHIGAAVISLLLVKASMVEAKSSVVNVYHPTDNCELIDAVMSANASGAPSIIDLGNRTFELTDDCFDAASAPGCLTAPNVPQDCFENDGSYSHGPNGLPEVERILTITNGRIVRAVDADPFRLIGVVGRPSFLSLFKVTLENGDAQGFLGPQFSDAGSGGALHVDGAANLQNSKIAFNRANDDGGGIYVADSSSLSVVNSIISNNRADALNRDGSPDPLGGGGGIFVAGSGVLSSLQNSTVSHNRTRALGAGLYNQGTVSSIENSTFSYNLACAVVSGSGECEDNATPTGVGGGIYNHRTADLLSVTQSTFWGNRAYQGGGIYNESANVFFNNNTIAHNFAQAMGGGIFNAGTINQLVSNLIAGNVDFQQDAPDINNSGTIVRPILPFDPPPTLPIIEGFNLIGDCGATNTECGLTNDVNKDIVGGSAQAGANIDPRLHDLSPNGGPTQTVALFPDSPAVNNGINNLGLSYDQRGPNFFRTVSQIDIGSFEVQYDLSRVQLSSN